MQTQQSLKNSVPESVPLMELQTIQTNQDLTRTIGWKNVRLLTYLGKNKSEHYRCFRISKRTGGYRTIYNPSTVMRVAQHKILSRVLDKVEIPDYIHAFEKDKSIPEMARQHVGKHVVVSVDIKDFFTSIHEGRLNTLFQGLGLGEKPAKTLSEICTYKYFVPQGALTSPKVSNIVTSKTFGPIIKEYCDARNLTLTIYADDITISSSSHFDINGLLVFLKQTLESFGFKINSKKTKVYTRKTRQFVCGVVVNEKTNLLRKDRKRLRAIVHNVTKNGIIPEAARSGKDPGEFISYLKGKLGWFKQLNIIQGTILMEKLDDYLKENPLDLNSNHSVVIPQEGSESTLPECPF